MVPRPSRRRYGDRDRGVEGADRHHERAAGVLQELAANCRCKLLLKACFMDERVGMATREPTMSGQSPPSSSSTTVVSPGSTTSSTVVGGLVLTTTV